MTYDIFVNNVKLDLTTQTADDVDVPLTFSIADFKNPEKRQRSFSKTIKLPGTRINNSFFASAVDVHRADVNQSGFGFEFDPTARYSVRVLRNGEEIFRGVCNLKDVDTLNGVNTFNLILYSELTNIIQALGDVLVSELGWDEYDHVLNISNIQDSWTAATGSGYWYPYIDYGLSSDPREIKTNQLFPFVYFTEIMEKCLQHIDYILDSPFMNTTLFKKFTFGYGGGSPLNLSSAEILSRQIDLSGDTPAIINPLLTRTSIVISGLTLYYYYEYLHIHQVNDTIMNLTVINDSLGQFDLPSGVITVANDGDYRLSLSCTVNTTYQFVFPGVGSLIDLNVVVTLRIYRNGAQVGSQPINVTSDISTIVFNYTQDLHVISGDVLSFRFDSDTSGTNVKIGVGFVDNFLNNFDINNDLLVSFIPLNLGLVDGDTVEIARFLPRMKAADFFRDMITMFNLYIDEPDALSNVAIDDFNSFYEDTDDADNWTDKEDQSKVINVASAANIEGKIYNFKFAEDNDYYKLKYFNSHSIGYGDYAYSVPSTFKKGTKDYQLSIAQSVPVQLLGTNIIIPRILSFDEGTGVTSPHKGKARCFINNGTVSSDVWKLINSSTLAQTTNIIYPLAHHLDSLTNPTFDLNFGKPEAVFYTSAIYTNNNLFSINHLTLIREITGRDSKIKKAYYKLDERDLYKGFMRRVANINGALWRKNIIMDFDSTQNKTTKVELVKVLKAKSNPDFQTPVPNFPPLFIDNVNEVDDPITSAETVVAHNSFYPVDTTVEDIPITLDPDFLRKGKKFEITKVSFDMNKVRIVPSVPGLLVDCREDEIFIDTQNDSLTFLFDGFKFKIV